MNRRTVSFSRYGVTGLLLAFALAALQAGFEHDFMAAADANVLQEPALLQSAVVASVHSRDDKAFGHALPMTELSGFTRMLEGKHVFSRTWVPDEKGPARHQGLGPLFNATSCIDCHFKDGRGGAQKTPPPTIFRVFGAVNPDADSLPGSWGQQLQDHGAAVAPEGQVDTAFEPVQGHYADGTGYTLMRPRYSLAGYPPQAALQLGPRIPPTLVGVGLLEAVGEQTLLAWADPTDADSDGISGRANFLSTGEHNRLGRFGWKSAQPGLAEQVAGALAEDMGIISPAHAAIKKPAEISGNDFASLLDYLRVLAPPAPRTDHPLFARGKEIFNTLQCGGCHRTRLNTVDTLAQANAEDLPQPVFGLTIEPYTDLLLHDMGTDLADGDGSTAIQREWRTAPLWGLGLMEVVNGQLLLLHDGRARSFDEAILWHGGEAQASRERFRRLSKPDREALVAFLQSI